MTQNRTALISVSDKSGIVKFAKGIRSLGYDIISTGGTATLLRENGVEVTNVADYTGAPEMLGGRVKTLHPKIHGGLLGLRDNESHKRDMATYGIRPIDLVVVNLYPFEETVKKGCEFSEAIEQIDIGGPSMLRGAGKNFKFVTVVIDPVDYDSVLDEMKRSRGDVSAGTRMRLVQKVFAETARYDAAIAQYLLAQGASEEAGLPEVLNISAKKISDLRYGENPHQRAAVFLWGDESPSVTGAKVLQGRELSYNNFLDADAALQVVTQFNETAAVIVKHTNPCGVATSAVSVTDAYLKARETDPVSAFGGILALNRTADADLAREIAGTFLEVVIAPGFDEGALSLLKEKKNLRLMEFDGKGMVPRRWDLRKISGGLLLQENDMAMVDIRSLPVMTERRPTDEEFEALAFAWNVVRYVKSNAIVFARPGQLVAVGAGQMSRVDSVKLAIMKAQLPIKGSVVASDAFFPFRDGVDEIAKSGATAVIQPGGSIRDSEVIRAANEHGLAMILTNMRHFRH